MDQRPWGFFYNCFRGIRALSIDRPLKVINCYKTPQSYGEERLMLGHFRWPSLTINNSTHWFFWSKSKASFNYVEFHLSNNNIVLNSKSLLINPKLQNSNKIFPRNRKKFDYQIYFKYKWWIELNYTMKNLPNVDFVREQCFFSCIHKPDESKTLGSLINYLRYIHIPICILIWLYPLCY